LTGRHPRRGEVWLAEMDKLRPAVVMHRDFAGRTLNAVLVAPLTTTLRDIPTAVRLGPMDGLDRDCMAALDNLTLLRKDRFVRAVARLSEDRMAQLCAALATATACDMPATRHRFGPGVDPSPP
jgi:mRNA interferase MazF